VRVTAKAFVALFVALVVLSALPATAFADDVFDALGETGQQLRATYEAISGTLSPFHGEIGSIQSGAPDVSGMQIYGGYDRAIYAKRIEGDPGDLASSSSREPREWVVVVASKEKFAGVVPYVMDVLVLYDPDRGVSEPTFIAQILDPWWMMQLWRSGGSPGYDPGKDPWRVALGGAAAVAAAAAAIAAAAASGAQRGGKRLDPKTPVGWVLGLSTNSLVVGEKQSAALQAQVYRVTADGGSSPAPANFSLVLPPGISANPPSAQGTLNSSVWQSGPAGPAANLTVTATTEGGSYSAGVTVHTSEETLLKLEPEARDLSAVDRKPVRVRARLVLSTPDRQDPAAGFEAARSAITFHAADPWLNVSDTVDTAEGKDVNVAVIDPDPGSAKQPPASVTLSVLTTIGGRQVMNSVVFDVGCQPTLDVKPDSVTFAAKSQDQQQVAVTVADPGVGQWKFTTRWDSGETPVATDGITAEGADHATLTLTEAAPESAQRQATGRLIVVAEHADLPKPLERQVMVTVVRQGLYLDQIGLAPDGTYHVDAQGTDKPKDLWVRVYVKDGQGHMGADATLASQVRIEMAESGKTVGSNAAEVSKLAWHAVADRPPADPGATWRFDAPTRIPGDTPTIPVRFSASVPGQSGPEFETQFTIGLIPEADGPGSPAAELEYQRAMTTIDKYVPGPNQAKLRQIVDSKREFLGAEGMTALRKWVFKQAVQLTLAEGDRGYEDVDKWATRITTGLDFATWAGNHCFSALMLIYGGPYVGMAGDVCKDLIVSAIQAWEMGQAPDDWLREQWHMIPGMVEGAAINPDVFQTMGLRARAVAWSLFVAYHFFKSYSYEKKPMLTAIREAGMAATDAAIGSFLYHYGHISAKGYAPGHGPGEQPPEHGPTEKSPAAEHAPGEKAPVEHGPGEHTAGHEPAGSEHAPGEHAPAEHGGAEHAASEHGAAEHDAAVHASGGEPAPAEPAASHEPGPAEAAAGHEPTPAGPEAQTPPPPVPHESAPAGHEPPPPSGGHEPTPPPKPTPPPRPTAPPPPKPKPKEPPLPPPPPTPSPAPPMRPGGPKTWQEAGALIKANTRTVNGVKVIDPAVIENVMRNPDAMRKLKGEDPTTWAAFHEGRQQIYSAHDAELENWIKDNVTGAKDQSVEVRSVGTANGVDRDLRAGVTITDPVTGQPRFIEIPKEKWQAQSNKIFSQKTGGPGDPAGQAKWAKDHQQLQTDQHHAEASVDMSDQGLVRDPQTGEWRQTQFDKSNLVLTEEGHSQLIDPEGLGRTYETKVAESYHAGNRGDAFAQAGKAVKTLDAVRKGYADQHYGVKEPPPKIKAGTEAIRQVEDGTLTPAEAEAKLKKMGYSDLPDFMEKISGQFGAFKWARQA
jgi:hypothetical protein